MQFTSGFSVESLGLLGQYAKPNGYADVVTLGLIALGSAGLLSRGKLWDRPDPYSYQMFKRPQQGSNGVRAKQQETRNVAAKLEQEGKDLVIFWGSQSGTAEGFANRLGRECHVRFGLETLVADLSDYDCSTISQIPSTKFVVFILSTFGEGDPSDNASEFWSWLHRNGDAKSSLDGLRYTVFGLGNSNYKYYNRVAEVVASCLEERGATCLLPLSLADDANGGTEEDFISWKENLFSAFQICLGLTEREAGYLPSLAVIEDPSLEPIDVHCGEPYQQSNGLNKSSQIRSLAIKSSKELFSSLSGRNCLHIDLDLSEYPQLRYKTGDHLAIWPVNPDVEVERLLASLGLDERRNTPLSIKSLNAGILKSKVPSPVTLEVLFRHYLEISAPLSRDVVRQVASFAPDATAKLYLQSISNDKEAFAALQARKVITLGRLLQLASGTNEKWFNLPLSFVIESLPTMQPRYYSISSSSVVSPRTVSVTAVVSSTKLCISAEEPQQVIHGLATNYLLAQHAISIGDQHPAGLTYSAVSPPGTALQSLPRLYASIRKSKFRLPALASHPLIMICAGTGIAPFRAFLQERARLKAMGKPVGRMLLFFGCRHPEQDYLYREELESIQRELNGALDIVTAFSRIPGQEKVYVQDRICSERWDSEVASLLIESSANIYVCGSAAMARGAAKSVREVVSTKMQWSGDDTDMKWKEWSEARKRGGRWMEDVWG